MNLPLLQSPIHQISSRISKLPSDQLLELLESDPDGFNLTQCLEASSTGRLSIQAFSANLEYEVLSVGWFQL